MKGTRIVLGGKERVLRYDLNAVAEIGDRLGLTVRIAHLGEDLLNARLPLSAIRTFVWAGLLHAEPDLTEKEVGSWVDVQENGREVFDAFFGQLGGTSLGLGDLTPNQTTTQGTPPENTPATVTSG